MFAILACNLLSRVERRRGEQRRREQVGLRQRLAERKVAVAYHQDLLLFRVRNFLQCRLRHQGYVMQYCAGRLAMDS